MAKKRKFVAYRKLERPYTRFSKYKKLAYVRTRPPCRIARFDMGDDMKVFSHQLDLLAGASIQIRDSALEAGRQTCNRVLEKTLTKNGFKMKVMTYPHHILRENPLAAGAGADRMSTGMSHSFGKVIGIAAQVKKGQPLFRVNVDKQHVETAKLGLKRAQGKVPCNCSIRIIEMSEKNKAAAAKKASEMAPVKKAVA